MILRILLPLLVLVMAGAYLMWPLTSDSFEINWNEKMIEYKDKYLSAAQVADSTSPNVLLIIVDDLSVADVTLCTKDAPVSTPFMSAFAERGVLFSNAYVSHSVCSPSRAAMFTGRYPQRFGFEHQMHDRYLRNKLEYYGFKYFVDSDPWIPQLPEGVPRQEDIKKQGLPPSEITLGEILQTKGYATGLIGKWHLGEEDHNQPCNFGFEEFYGFSASHSLYTPEGTAGIVDQKIPDDWTDDYIWSGQRNGPHAITRNCEPIEENEYLTFRIAEETIAFMEKNRDRPFFACASFNAPHTPLQAPEEYVQMFSEVEDPVKRVHYGMIAALDDAIGSLSNYLATSGLDSNTLVFFISDNGGAEYNLTTENGEYRGGKITDFEGGIKVPMFMSMPGTIPEGMTYAHPVISMDMATTISEITNTKLPADRTYDGVDLSEAVSTTSPVHEALFWRKGYNGAVRDSQWKMRWDARRGDTTLYDLTIDPEEANDVFTQNPEVVQRLTQTFNSWAAELEEPLWPSLIDYYSDIDGKRYWFDN